MRHRISVVAAVAASLSLLGLSSAPAAHAVALSPIAVAPLVVAAAGSPASDQNDVTWGVRTGDGGQGARENYDLTVDPGGRVDDAIVVSNYNDEPLEIDLYAADGFTNISGELDAAPRSDTPTSVGAWVTFAEPHVTVPPGVAISIPFSITVPADVTPGDYAGAVLTSLTRASSDQGLTVDRRLGVRVKLRVTGEVAPALSIEDLRVDYAGAVNPFGTGAATITYTLRNTGNVRLSAEQSIEMTGPLGLFPANVPSLTSAPEVLPGETWKVTQRVEGVVPAFALFTTATITPRIAADAVSAGASPELADIAAEAVAPAVPWALLVLLLAIAAIVVLTARTTRRRRKATAERDDARVQQAVSAALSAERESVRTPN